MDYRRAHLGEVPEDYLLHYLTSAAQAQPALRDLAAYLENRIPGPDVTPDQLRSRSWWTGAEVFVVVDDYDLVATQQSSPVQPLQPLMAQARDTGLHVVVARRSEERPERSMSRSSSRCATSRCPGCCSREAPTKGLSSAT